VLPYAADEQLSAQKHMQFCAANQISTLFLKLVSEINNTVAGDARSYLKQE
jgi:CheY-specific phosphatase CheX